MKNRISKVGTPLLLLYLILSPFSSFAEETPSEVGLRDKPSQAPDKIEVKPKTRDLEISKRLDEIMQSTNWFTNLQVEVKNGVVFLSGNTKNQQFKDWAGDLTRNTQDVTAVINKIVIVEPSVWDLQLITKEMLLQAKKIARALPSILFGSLILFIAWVLARLLYKLILLFFRNKGHSLLIHELIARGLSLLIFLFGIYFIFEMADLTTMALTVISGTGLIGLILGIAFRDITENFLASILLSMQNPFHEGDLIDLIPPVSSHILTGYVDRLTLRVTILVTPEGNHLQIPNATVYKSNIRNYTTNPNRREDFIITIGTGCSISKAEELALKVIVSHEAVLKSPEPLVLVDSLTQDVVNLRIYYWINSKKHNWLKVKSKIIRLIKQSFQSEGIDLPWQETSQCKELKEAPRTKSETESTHDHQKNETKGITSESRIPEKGENFLDPNKTN